MVLILAPYQIRRAAYWRDAQTEILNTSVSTEGYSVTEAMCLENVFVLAYSTSVFT